MSFVDIVSTLESLVGAIESQNGSFLPAMDGVLQSAAAVTCRPARAIPCTGLSP
jgi:hypothetical protein